jgi:DNA adenine methylase
MRSAVKWSGGKTYLYKKIIEQFGAHRIFVDAYAGGGNVILNNKPCDVEVYNDLNMDISNFFYVLREHKKEFIDKLRLVPFSQVEFRRAQKEIEKGKESERRTSLDEGDVSSALNHFIIWRQSFGGAGKTWSCATTRARGAMAGDVNAWWTAIEGLGDIVARLKRIQILCMPAIDVIRKFDHQEALIYCDPPYVHSTRSKGSTDTYFGEMSDAEHMELAEVLKACKSKVVLSGYPSKLYEGLYKGWRTVEFDIANHAAGGKKKGREIETLWINY